MLLTEHDVVNMRFKEPEKVENGYEQDEVDFFLDEVAETIAQLTKDKSELENQLQVAQARIVELETALEQRSPEAGVAPTEATSPQQFAPVTESAESAAGVLALAQKLHDQYVSEGQAEKDRLINEATEEANRVRTEADEHRANTMNQLDQERQVIEHKITELRDFERDYRTRLKSYLQSLIANVENDRQDG